MNGKGDRDRTTDREAFRRNYDRIFGGGAAQPQPRRLVLVREEVEIGPSAVVTYYRPKELTE